jgi:hypothetical protein
MYLDTLVLIVTRLTCHISVCLCCILLHVNVTKLFVTIFCYIVTGLTQYVSDCFCVIHICMQILSILL